MQAKDREMIPIPIHDFLLGTKYSTHLYVKLSDEKYVMIAKAGAPAQREQILNYNNKAIDYLWIRREDYNRMVGHNTSLAGMILNRKDIDLSKKTAVLTQAAASVFGQIQEMGFSLEVYNNAKVITDAMVAVCETHKDLSQVFALMKGCSDKILANAIAVSMLSVMVGSKMGFEKRLTLEKLSLGGFLHDVGLKALPTELLNKPLALMTPEENSLYETHCYKGMQMLLSLGVVPDDIVSIVYEHHETSIGQGYPQRIRDVKIHPLAKIVSVSDQFVSLTLANVNCPTAKSPNDALLYIESTMGQPFGKEAFKALRKVIQSGSSISVA